MKCILLSWVLYTYPHYIPHLGKLKCWKALFLLNCSEFNVFLQHFLRDFAKNIQIPTGDSSGWGSREYVKPPRASTYFSVIGLHVFTFIVTL